jgi:hypothetical protein
MSQGRMYDSADMNFHIQRFIGTRDALVDGQIIPQLDPNVLEGAGSAPNIFYGPLSAYINVALSVLFKHNFVMSVPFFFILCIFASAISMYHLTKYITKREASACISAIIYLSMPLFMYSVFEWQSFGTILAFVFLPLIVLGFYKILDQKTHGVLLLSLATIGLVLSHMLSTMIIGLFIIILCIVNWRRIFKKQILPKLVVSLLFVLLITAFFTVPFLEAKSLGLYNIFDDDFLSCFMWNSPAHLNNNSIPLVDLFYSTGFVSLGLFSVIIIVLALLNRKTLDKKYNSISFVVIGSIFALFTTTLVPWEYMPSELLILQFPWRLMIISNFCFSVIAGDVIYKSFEKFKHKSELQKLLLAIIIIIAFTCHQANAVARDVGRKEHVAPTAVSLEPIPFFSGIAVGEYLPKQVIGIIGPTTKNISDHSKLPEFISGSGRISDYSKIRSHMSFNAEVYEISTIELPVIYYKGYDITIDGTPTDSTWSDTGYLKFDIPEQGNHAVQIRFTGSSLTKISAVATLLGLISLVIYSTFDKFFAKNSKT